MREWQVKRRERTRQLIELGGLVGKADLVELTEDDRAALYGAFLTVAAKLRGPDGAQALVLFRRKGKRAFEAEQSQSISSIEHNGDGQEKQLPKSVAHALFLS